MAQNGDTHIRTVSLGAGVARRAGPGEDQGPTPAISRGLFVILVGLGVCAVVVCLLATRSGVGISPDSTVYITAARNLLRGRGLVMLADGGHESPLIHYPPLYPALLSMFGACGLDLVVAARWLNAFIFGANVSLVGYAIAWSTEGAWPATLCGTFLAMMSTHLVHVHSSVWSEPCFIALVLICLLILAGHLGSRSLAFFIACSVMMAVATLTRYAGIVLVPTGALALLVLGEGPLRTRVRDSLVLAGAGLLPPVLWMSRNLHVAHDFVNRSIVLHPPGWDRLRAGAETMGAWLLPGRIAETLANRGLQDLYALGLVAAFVGALWMVRSGSGAGMRTSGRTALPVILSLFVALYGTMLVVSLSILDASIPLDGRILSPVLACLLIIGVTAAHRWSVVTRSPKVVGSLLALTFAGLASLYLVRAVHLVREESGDARGYASAVWGRSQLLEAVRSLPEGVRIFTNGPDAIYYFTGRTAQMVPARIHPSSLQPNPRYPKELASVVEDLASHDAVLVWFRALTWRGYLAPETDLRSSGAWLRRSEFADGFIEGSGERVGASDR